MTWARKKEAGHAAVDSETAILTGDLYGSIWESLGSDGLAQLGKSIEQWAPLQIDDTWLEGKTCLDAGCGGGVFSQYLSKRNPAMVVGFDIGGKCLESTRQLTESEEKRVRLVRGSVLELPFTDDKFDFVLCSGVLHHTIDPEWGFQELVRVCKPGGVVFVGLYGKGGFIINSIEAIKYLLRLVPYRVMVRLLHWMKVGPVTRYMVLDYVYVPIRHRYRARDIVGWYEAAGLEKIEQHHANHPVYKLPKWLKGEGWLMLYGTKRKSTPVSTSDCAPARKDG